jgi:hypothetical protein
MLIRTQFSETSHFLTDFSQHVFCLLGFSVSSDFRSVARGHSKIRFSSTKITLIYFTAAGIPQLCAFPANHKFSFPARYFAPPPSLSCPPSFFFLANATGEPAVEAASIPFFASPVAHKNCDLIITISTSPFVN